MVSNGDEWELPSGKLPWTPKNKHVLVVSLIFQPLSAGVYFNLVEAIWAMVNTH